MSLSKSGGDFAIENTEHLQVVKQRHPARRREPLLWQPPAHNRSTDVEATGDERSDYCNWSTQCQNSGNNYSLTPLHIWFFLITLLKARSQSVEMTHFFITAQKV